MNPFNSPRSTSPSPFESNSFCDEDKDSNDDHENNENREGNNEDGDVDDDDDGDEKKMWVGWLVGQSS